MLHQSRGPASGPANATAWTGNPTGVVLITCRFKDLIRYIESVIAKFDAGLISSQAADELLTKPTVFLLCYRHTVQRARDWGMDAAKHKDKGLKGASVCARTQRRDLLRL